MSDRHRRDRPPLALVVPATLAVAFMAVPLISLLQRAPWSSLHQRLGQPEVSAALRLSLGCSLAATLVSVVLGVPLAWVLARTELPEAKLLLSKAISGIRVARSGGY